MTVRAWCWIGVVAVVTVLSLAPTLATAQSAAQKSQDIPRLTDGKPDFNGIWDRPRVADITRNGNACGSGSTGCKQEGAGELPYTAWGLEQWKGPRFDYSARCLPWGYTRAMGTEYPIEIMHTPQRLAILFESNNVFHVVPLDGRSHPKDLEPTWLGNSVGKWEGDTLVIDTIGFNGRTWIDTGEHPMSDAMHVTERLHYIDARRLSYEVTWDDPKTYTKPLKNTRVWVRMKPGEELMEYWCMENNKDLLEGHLSPTHTNPK